MPGFAPRSVFAALLALGLAVPAAAQFSDSYKFLEAVKKKEGDKVTDMLAEGGSSLINTRDLTSGESALHVVTKRRDLTWMQFLIGKGANVNIRDSQGETPLVEASNLGFVDGVELLLTFGGRVDESSNTGETPLINAVLNRNIEMMRVLLKAGANPDRAARRATTPGSAPMPARCWARSRPTPRPRATMPPRPMAPRSDPGR
jgi:hypothetical protein